MGKKRGIYFFVGLVLLLSVAIVSPSVFRSSGKASFDSQDVSVTVSGANSPVVEYVESLPSTSPVEYSSLNVYFLVNVSDADGSQNINDSSVSAEFIRGPITRPGSCVLLNTWTNTKSYNCTVVMEYYDSAGDWTMNVSALDEESNYAENSSEFFPYQVLRAFVTPLDPSQVIWPVLNPGATDQDASNDPTIVNNTGNYDGNIFIEGYDLVGEDNPSENISSTNFSVAETLGNECTGTSLSSDGVNTDTGINANPGPPGSNTADIYYCIPLVPTVSSQTYSTSARGVSWVVNYV